MIKNYLTYINESEELDQGFFNQIKGWQLDTWMSDKVYHYKKKLEKEVKDYLLGKIVRFNGGKTIKVSGFIHYQNEFNKFHVIDEKGNYHKIENIIEVKDENEMEFIRPLSKIELELDPLGEEDWEKWLRLI